MLRAAMTSATVMSLGDVLCQSLQARRAREGEDARATARRASASCSGLATKTREDAPRARESDGAGFEHDFERTGRFFVVGAALHGPFFHVAFRALERAMGASTSAATVARKVAVGHAVLFPTYTAGFFFFMSALEGETMTAACDRFRDKAAETFISGTCYWPFANAFNFAYVPRAGRILFLNAAGVAWNAYMSHVVSASDESKSQGGDASALVASVK